MTRLHHQYHAPKSRMRRTAARYMVAAMRRRNATKINKTSEVKASVHGFQVRYSCIYPPKIPILLTLHRNASRAHALSYHIFSPCILISMLHRFRLLHDPSCENEAVEILATMMLHDLSVLLLALLHTASMSHIAQSTQRIETMHQSNQI